LEKSHMDATGAISAAPPSDKVLTSKLRAADKGESHCL